MKLPLLLTALAVIALSAFAADPKPTSATPPENLKVADGFKVELLKSATPREGSWVCMAIDDRGRLYISPQNPAPEGGILRITLDEKGQVAKEDWIKLNVSEAMGMLWAFDNLYVNGKGPNGHGIYRLRDTDGDGELDKVYLFKKVPNGGGEHGAHGMVRGPDNKIYIVQGNATPLVDGIAPDSPLQNYGEDDLLPRIKDPVATFFDNIKKPYGHILRTDERGEKWELFAGGMRNAYDIDFNADGELFTYDSDMEWDVGLPWYRPTRILHLVPGGEYGFREGTAKWPAYYADSLGSVVDIGRGCPTGVKFGTNSNFPEKYKKAFFVMDWTYGRILAVHMKPQGATYTASNPLSARFDLEKPDASEDVEVFLSGKGMPVTDLEFGQDGAMYFTTGGRGAQAGLYRVSWTPPRDALAEAHRTRTDAERRAQVSAMTNGKGAGSAEWLNPWLYDEDPMLRFRARTALEELPAEKWTTWALKKEKFTGQPVEASLLGLLALARTGDKSLQPSILTALQSFPLDSLDDEQKLLKLRIIEVSFARQGRPDDAMVQRGIEKLGHLYPAETFDLNRELSQLLVWLGAPDVVEKTLALMKATPEHAEQIWYANVLREAKQWTPAQRDEYFAWFKTAESFKGGNSLKKFILRIREEAVKKLPDEERTRLASVLGIEPPPVAPPRPAVNRTFQKNWAMADLLDDLPQAAKGRNFARGKEIYASTQCAQCHHFGPDGGNVGPDLTAVGNRFGAKDVLEAIIEPSKAISEQYASVVLTMKDGTVQTGQLAEEDNARVCLIVDPVAGKKEWFRKPDITSREISKVSLMPPGLLNVLTKEEILDLLAYLASGGNEKAEAFAK